MRYDDKQASEILRRALSRADGASKEDGVDLEELVRVGRELGASEEDVRAAAMEQSAQRSDELASRMVEETVIDAEFTEDDWPEVVHMLQREMNQPGEATRVGSGFSWQAETASAMLTVRDGKTWLTLQTDRSEATGLAWTMGYVMPAFFGTAVPWAIGGKEGWPMWLRLGVVGMTVIVNYFFVRHLIHRGHRRTRTRMRETVARLAERIRSFRSGETQRVRDRLESQSDVDVEVEA